MNEKTVILIRIFNQDPYSSSAKYLEMEKECSMVCETSVPDPDPPDPQDFGPPRSGSISQRYGSGSFYQKAK
jgi:hypothetical protein